MRLATEGTIKRNLDNDIPVLLISTNMASTKETEQEKKALESYEKPTKQEFSPHSSELYTLSDQVYEIETNISDLRKFFEAQRATSDFAKLLHPSADQSQL